MKDMRRINKLYPIHKNPQGVYVIFAEVGSGKNGFTSTLAGDESIKNIELKYMKIRNIIDSYNTPIARIVIPEIKSEMNKINKR